MNLDKVVKDVFKLLFVADTNIYLLFRGGGSKGATGFGQVTNVQNEKKKGFDRNKLS